MRAIYGTCMYMYAEVLGGTKSLIFHVTCAHTNACHRGCVPAEADPSCSYSHYAEAQKSRDPQGIPSLNSVVSIADHGHICFVRGSRGITLENRR